MVSESWECPAPRLRGVQNSILFQGSCEAWEVIENSPPGGKLMLILPKILFLSNDDAEARKWEEILREDAILSRVRDLVELQQRLHDDIYDALLCGWEFTNGTWNDVIRHARQQRPSLPVVIFNGTEGGKLKKAIAMVVESQTISRSSPIATCNQLGL